MKAKLKLVGTVVSKRDNRCDVTFMKRIRSTAKFTVTKISFAAHDEAKTKLIRAILIVSAQRRTPIKRSQSFKLSRIIETGHAAIELKEEV